MDTDEMSQFLVNEGLRLGADEIIALTTNKTLRQIRFGNSEITITKTWDEVVAEVLLEKDKRVLTATMTDTSRDSIQRTLKDLIAMTKVMKPHENYSPLPEGPFKYREIPRLYDKRISKKDTY